MSSAEQIIRLEQAGRQVLVDWADGHHSVFHAIWLRDNCTCAECRHPSGQRLLDTASLPADIAPASVSQTEGAVTITWSGDGHRSTYAPAWLRAHCYAEAERARRRPAPRLWDAEMQSALPEAEHAVISRDEAALRAWLAAIETFGFALLRGVPVVPGEVTRVVALFGYVRETNYGRLFDVRSVVNPNNLAYTGLALGGHTDNPYRDPTPSLQLLHCLSSSTSGGENTLVDGFRVAAALRARRPSDYDLLTRHPVRFRFQDEDTDLSAEFPILMLNPLGELIAVHYNNRSPEPFDLPPDQVEPYYAAYRHFVGLLESPAYQVRFKLEPGDLFIVDNLRVLHGRTGFSAAGQRHLQGCYADRDSLRSRLAVLNRSLPTEAS
jgi:gamma-butyrobetaine hydroxylase